MTFVKYSKYFIFFLIYKSVYFYVCLVPIFIEKIINDSVFALKGFECQMTAVSLCLKANAEMVPKTPSCHYMLFM